MHHPGEGRGPVGKVQVNGGPSAVTSVPQLDPAFAGVVLAAEWERTLPYDGLAPTKVWRDPRGLGPTAPR